MVSKICPAQWIGAHFSVAKGLENAIYEAGNLGCRVLQIFTKNARTWKETMPSKQQVKVFLAARQDAGIHSILSHCTYLINIASNDREKLEKSTLALEAEMRRSAMLEIDYVVLHPGAHLGEGEIIGLKTAAGTLNRVLSKLRGGFPSLLIETTAGQGTSLGKSFEQIAFLLEQIHVPAGPSSPAAGVCLDTSHVFAAGYDLRTPEAFDRTLSEFDRIIGIEHLLALHLNDSKTAFGSAKDRHEHIGKGTIGLKGFELIMNDTRLEKIPKILETPKLLKNTPMDPVNLDLLRNMISNS